MSLRSHFLTSLVAYLLIINIASAFDGGTGDPNDPYQISTPEHLFSTGSNADLLNKHYILTEDIELSGYEFISPVIAWNSVFTGVFDGNGHVISNVTMTIKLSNVGGGLFGNIGLDGEIRNLGLENIDITGGNCVGGIAAGNSGAITSCYATGSVSGSDNVGGLVGINSHGSITASYAVCTTQGGRHVGGLVGYNAYGSITASYANGTGIGVGGYFNIGGLVGHNFNGTITSCYAYGTVKGNNVGGLVGYNSEGTIMFCYSTSAVSGTTYVGGLAGVDNGIIRACFWDTQTSGQTTSMGGLGLSSAEMKEISYYSNYGWSGGTWILDVGNDYPHLFWETSDGVEITDPTVSMAGSGTAEDPWIITSKDEFMQVFPGSFFWDKHYRLETDIDMSGTTYYNSLIGNDRGNAFIGSFNGNKHIIRNLTIKSYGLGLFGCVGFDGKINNLGIVNVNIMVEGYAGGLVGYNSGGTITSCYATGSVSGYDSVGGLVGYNHGGTITSCYATDLVTGPGIHIGGLVGTNNEGIVTSSYATGPVRGSRHGAGGLVGGNFYGIITSCYATGSVSGSEAIGGLVGEYVYGNIEFCYSTGYIGGSNRYIGGMVGLNYQGPMTSCFWDIETSGITGGLNGTGKTTVQMQTRSTFTDAGWDFDNIWWINNHRDYPKLFWQPFGNLNNDSYVNFSDFAIMSASWLSTDTDPDFNSVCELSGDDTIDMADLSALIDMWLEGPRYGD